MSLIDTAKAHRAAISARTIKVPEWGQGAKPLVVHAPVLSVAQKRRCWRNAKGEMLDGSIACVRAVVFYAQDEKGNRLFDDMDEHAMTHDVDADIVARVGGFILGFVSGVPRQANDEVEDAKND